MRSPSSPRQRRATPRRTRISVDEVWALWRGIEQHRRQITEAYAIFADWLAGSPQLAKEWRGFIAAGGVNADDFIAFLDGKFRPLPVLQQRHLRLIPAPPKTKR